MRQELKLKPELKDIQYDETKYPYLRKFLENKEYHLKNGYYVNKKCPWYKRSREIAFEFLFEPFIKDFKEKYPDLVYLDFDGHGFGNFQVDHIDGNKLNDNPDNLKIITKDEHDAKTGYNVIKLGNGSFIKFLDFEKVKDPRNKLPAMQVNLPRTPYEKKVLLRKTEIFIKLFCSINLFRDTVEVKAHYCFRLAEAYLNSDEKDRKKIQEGINRLLDGKILNAQVDDYYNLNVFY